MNYHCAMHQIFYNISILAHLNKEAIFCFCETLFKRNCTISLNLFKIKYAILNATKISKQKIWIEMIFDVAINVITITQYLGFYI